MAFVCIITSKSFKDDLCATQIGLAILNNRPIFLLIKKGTLVPDNLLKIASQCEFFEDDLKSAYFNLFQH